MFEGGYVMEILVVVMFITGIGVGFLGGMYTGLAVLKDDWWWFLRG